MIIYKGREYAKIRQFDCRILDFAGTGGGGYCTVLPISSLEHRQKYSRDFPNKVEITRDDQFTHFAITDDWGNVETVSVGNEHTEEIESAIQEAKLQGLMA